MELILIILIFNINPIEEIRVRLAEREERKTGRRKGEKSGKKKKTNSNESRRK